MRAAARAYEQPRSASRAGAACSTMAGSRRSPTAACCCWHEGALAGYLGVIHAERRIGGRTVRTANLSSWYILKPWRGQGLGLAMLQHATRDPGVTCTTFSSNPPALRVMAAAGLVPLDDTRLLWRRSGSGGGRHRGALGPRAAAARGAGATSAGCSRITGTCRSTPICCAPPEGDCLVVLSIKRKGADVAWHEVLHLGRPALLARHAQAFADAVLAPGESVLAVDSAPAGRARDRRRRAACRSRCRATSARPTSRAARSTSSIPRSRCSTSSSISSGRSHRWRAGSRIADRRSRRAGARSLTPPASGAQTWHGLAKAGPAFARPARSTC